MEMTISQLFSPVKLYSISSSSSMLSPNVKSKKNLNRAADVSFDYVKEKQRSHALVVRKTRATVDENQSSTTTTTSGGSRGQRWLLQPVGDGDTRHIGYKVDMPPPFEITCGQVIIGRLPEKADVVIPVATVSGVHATINTKVDNLLVTDMNSTNGTFIEDKRLIPGVASPAFPGTRITFGDTNLAIFRVFKLQDSEEETTEKQPQV
ncbi:unnamed protein product [Cochlearia groenlandica]